MELRMSQKERDRLKIIEQLDQRRLSQARAAELLKLGTRQVRRILTRWRQEGDQGLVHRRRGRPALNVLRPALRRRVVELIRKQYKGFGPTLVTEHLASDHGIEISRETVRQWMRAKQLYTERRKRGHRRHRPRRECLGELAQLDTSEHDWFEGRGESAALIHLIDDATSLSVMRFYPADTTLANMDLIGRWIGRYGRPLAFYMDYAAHFKQLGRRGRRLARKIQTQIERALGELRIEMINARSPQAKGRVERSFGTLQDRLIKEMRLRQIRTIEEANRFLDREFIPFWNKRFTVRAAQPLDAHRSAQGLDLGAILSVQHTRRVNNDYTIQFRSRRWQLDRGPDGGELAGQRVCVEERVDGSMRVRWRQQYLECAPVARANPEVVAAAAQEAALLREDSLRSSSLRSAASCAPTSREPLKLGHAHKPAPDHPWRKRTFLPVLQKTDIAR